MQTTETRLQRPDVTLIGTASGDGPPALLLHAGGERRQTWEPVAAELARAGYSTVAFDQRGHGDSDPAGAGADRLPLFAADVEAMIGTLDAAPVLVGSSLGGLAALHALAEPRLEGRVAGLMLVDVVPDPPPDRTRAWLARTLGARANQPLIDDILGRADALRAGASRLTLPVTLVRGGPDSVVTDTDTGRLLELVPHATVATIPSAGHLMARDAPIELASEVIAFLGDPRVRRRRIDEFLARSGAGSTAHPGGTLLSHLHRTADTLESWGASGWLVDAARLHAAYGTDGYPHPVHGADRATLVALAGARTEALVARYCNCDRQDSYPTFVTDAPSTVDRHTGRRTPLTGTELRAFAELTIVNELDVFAHAPDIAAQQGEAAAKLFRSWLPLVSEPARDAVQRLWREP